MSISIYVDTPFRPTSQDMGFFMKFFPLLDSVPILLVPIRAQIRTLIKLTAPKFRALAATAAISFFRPYLSFEVFLALSYRLRATDQPQFHTDLTTSETRPARRLDINARSMALKGKLKEIFTKKKDAKDEDRDPISQLAKLGGVSEVKFPKGFAPSREILVPSRFAALAQYLIDHANEYTGVFRKTGHKPTLTKLREYFINALLNAPQSAASTSPAIVPATMPYDSIGYTIYEVADCFKLFLQELPGGILGDASLFETLRKSLPPVQLKPADLDLDFSCGGVEATVDTKKIARILRDSSGRDRRNLILLVFGVLAVARNDSAQIETKGTFDSERGTKVPEGDDTQSAKSIESTGFSLSRFPSRRSETGRLSQELKKVRSQQKIRSIRKKSSKFLGKQKGDTDRPTQEASQEQSGAVKGTFVDPLEFRARSQSVASTSRPPTPPSRSPHRAPSPSNSIRPALHSSHSIHTLRWQESDMPSRPSLRRMKTSGSIRRAPVYTDPTAPPALPGAQAILAGLVPESSSLSPGAPSEGISRLRSNSSVYSRYPQSPDINFPAETPSTIPGPQTSNLTLSRSTMTSAALGTIFAPLLLGDLTGNIEVHEGSDKAGRGGNDPSASGPSENKLAGPVKRGLRRFLKKKGVDEEVELEKADQEVRIAAWVVELLVRHWEAIVAEYGKGIEGVEAVVEGLWDYD